MTLLRWVIILSVVAFAVQVWSLFNIPGETIPYTRFRSLVQDSAIATVTLDGATLYATGHAEKGKTGAMYNVTLPTSIPDTDLLRLLESKRVTVTALPDRTSTYTTLLWFIIPLATTFLLLWFLNRRMRMQSSSGGLLSMGKMNAAMYSKERVHTRFSDVAGMKEQKEALFEMIHFLTRPEDFKKLGGSMPKGVLLVGPPGTGKTLLARAVAGEAGVPFFHVAGSSFLEMLVGVGASRVRDLFATAKKSTPCIIFIDEIDSIGRRRGGIQGFYGGGASEMEQTLNQLLTEMDGFEPNEDVIVIAATNQPEVLDPALLRPGRFDRRVAIDLPSMADREDILKVHLKKIRLADDVSVSDLARSTPGNSGADLKNLVNEAAILASKQRKDAVEMQDFRTALDTIMLGHVRSSLILQPEEKRRTAYHEAGHALAARLLPTADPVTKITIVPRGRALGVTMQTPIDERHNYTVDYLRERLIVLLGGRVAEELVFDTISTGAENDLMQCTTLARNMVARYGMSEKIGALSLLEPGANGYLGDNPYAGSRNFSEDTLRLVDTETRRLIDEAHEATRHLLREHRSVLDRVAEALLEKEILEGEEFAALCAEEIDGLSRS